MKHCPPLLILLFQLVLGTNEQRHSWPIPAETKTHRPTGPYPRQCNYNHAIYCDGDVDSKIQADDHLKVFYGTNPVLFPKFGVELAELGIYHSFFEIHSSKLGINFTLEYFAWNDLIHTSYPYVSKDSNGQYDLIWCQQSSSCASEGVEYYNEDKNRTEADLTGYRVFLGTLTGAQFIKVMDEIRVENTTHPFYYGYHVKYEPDGQEWFEPKDCASFVTKAINLMVKNGANFNYPDTPKTLRVSQMIIFSEMPELLGDWETVKQNSTLVNEIADYFAIGDPLKMEGQKLLLGELQMFNDQYFTEKKDSFMFYNEKYWRLKLRAPYMVTPYTKWALPV